MQTQISLASVLWQNFLKYDFIVFLLAGITIFFLILSLKRSNAFFAIMNRTVYVPEEQSAELVKTAMQEVREYDVVLLRRKMLSAYGMFANFIVIFPLLGILGTVISLLPMVSQMGQADIQANFFGALTSTFWGLVFAIIFKAIDGWISGRIEDNENSARLYFERRAGEKR